MEIRYYKHYSGYLKRDMEFKIYGHRGKPVLYIPCQCGRFWDFESFGMIGVWEKWIEEGRVTVYSVDPIDGETYANFGGDCAWRAQQHENWFNYIINELVPTIRHLSGERNFYDQPIMTFGCSMGATHAATLFFRRPDIFDSVMALSGLYEPGEFFGNYMDGTLYNNSPNLFLQNMPHDHPYIEMYNRNKMLFCVGQGAWEDGLKESTGRLAHVMYEKGIHGQTEFWGCDVSHDWYWWYRQVEHYMPQFLEWFDWKGANG